MTDKPKRKRRRTRRTSDAQSVAPDFDNDIVPGIPDTPENIARTFWGKVPNKDGGFTYTPEGLRIRQEKQDGE